MAKKPTIQGTRSETVRVKTAKGRKLSSTLWLQRQLNDPYVQAAKREGYRSRAAYKLIEMDDKLHFLKPNMRIVDLGAAPGGWTQVATERARSESKSGHHIVGIDLLAIDPIPGAELIQLDFMDDTAPDRLKELLGGQADVVLSDMGPNTVGHPGTDHLRIMALVEAAYLFAREVLKPGGAFITKVWQGGAEHNLLRDIKRDFKSVKHIKPQASRADSAEMYLAATGFRGSAE